MRTPQRIYIPSSTFAEYDDTPLRMLEDEGFEVSLNSSGKRLGSQDLINAAKDSTAVIAGLEIYDSHVLAQLPHLRCISRIGVGMETIDLNLARKKGISVFNTPDVVIQPVAEMTLAMMLDLLRGITRHAVLMRTHQWQRTMGEQLAHKTVGVLGLGRIGRRVAELLIKLDCTVIGYDISPDHQWARINGIRVVSLDELIKEADILTIHLSPLVENPLCLSASHLAHMKKGALVINVARGIFIDEHALEESLLKGHLAGAALDVFQEEPYYGPLAHLPNVILTPHIATFTRQSRVNMEVQAVEHVIRFLKNI